MGNRSIAALATIATFFALASLLAHCVGGDDSSSQDALSDNTVDTTTPIDAGFALSLTPSHVTEDPGDSFPITINVNRALNFNDAITFTVTAPPGLTASQPAPAGASSLFYLSASDAGALGAVTVTVTGTNGSLVENAKLDVFIGSVFVLDGGTFVAPTFANALTVKVWGAGGGGGQDCTPTTGGSGGGGGFASGTLAVVGGESFLVSVGTGGVYTNATCTSGGGGGAYSAFALGDGGVLLLGGGGGGGGTGNGSTAGNGGYGGGGGGLVGGASAFCADAGGTQSGGGSGCSGGAAGTAFQGGAGAGTAGNAGGVPGGGAGATTSGASGTGGGGGGYFGGGGGENSGAIHVGGGGGSGFNALDGGALTAASNATAAATTDSDYVAGVGAGGQKTSGGPGRVVVRLPKP